MTIVNGGASLLESQAIAAFLPQRSISGEIKQFQFVWLAMVDVREKAETTVWFVATLDYLDRKQCGDSRQKLDKFAFTSSCSVSDIVLENG
ncbi:Heat Repeat-Containing Protein 6 [Manis pentadactyla]|nr:Heat Repeat-Containing Protein 6 [Manis pentadactyla]